jgi:hypothetical protein
MFLQNFGSQLEQEGLNDNAHRPSHCTLTSKKTVARKNKIDVYLKNAFIIN